MSVIGTTLKQPRVFAHDAVALKDLPGCKLNGLVQIADTVAQNGGSGFLANQTYRAYVGGNPQNTFDVLVNSVNASGRITSLSILNANCPNSTQLSGTEYLTVAWSPQIDPATGQMQALDGGTSAVDFFQVEINTTEWDYGCPITPIYPFNKENPINLNMTKQFLAKNRVRWEDEDGCEVEALPPGAAIYIGYDVSTLTVVMESGTVTTFKNVPAGTFMPIAVMTVLSATNETPGTKTPEELKGEILALF